jgi:hypothetical protein
MPNYFLVWMQIARDAYQSVILISIAEYINEPEETFQKLIPEWRKRSTVDYNVSFGPKELVSQVDHFYDQSLSLFGTELRRNSTTFL